MIYFLEAVGFGAVKIGCSEHLGRRLRCLRSQSPPGLEWSLIRTMAGGPEHEAHLHEVFRPWRISGEWFQADALRDVIPLLCNVPGKAREYVTIVGSCGHEKQISAREAHHRKRIEKTPCRRCASLASKAVEHLVQGARERKAKNPWDLTKDEDIAKAKSACVCVKCGDSLRLLRRNWYMRHGYDAPRRCRSCAARAMHKAKNNWDYEKWWRAGLRARGVVS